MVQVRTKVSQLMNTFYPRYNSKLAFVLDTAYSTHGGRIGLGKTFLKTKDSNWFSLVVNILCRLADRTGSDFFSCVLFFFCSLCLKFIQEICLQQFGIIKHTPRESVSSFSFHWRASCVWINVHIFSHVFTALMAWTVCWGLTKQT